LLAATQNSQPAARPGADPSPWRPRTRPQNAFIVAKNNFEPQPGIQSPPARSCPGPSELPPGILFSPTGCSLVKAGQPAQACSGGYYSRTPAEGVIAGATAGRRRQPGPCRSSSGPAGRKYNRPRRAAVQDLRSCRRGSSSLLPAQGVHSGHRRRALTFYAQDVCEKYRLQTANILCILGDG